MKQLIVIRLGPLALKALAGSDEDGASHIRARAVRALRYYISDLHSERVDWPCPSFLYTPPVDAAETVELEVDSPLWESFIAEAERQDVGVELLVNHAILFYTADRDAGRVTQRILDDFDRN